METVVVRRDPRRRRRLQGVVIAGVLLGLAAAFTAGRWFAVLQWQQRQEQLSGALQRADVAEQALAEAQQRLNNLEVGAQVDRDSVELLRQNIRKQQQTIAALEEENAFYKGLMAPTERERGLGIRGWELYRGSEPGRFHYKLTVQQLAVKHSVLSGYVTVDIAGRRNSKETSLALHSVSPQFDEKQLKLRFKYFQNIEGELHLPADFEPQRVDVVAYASRPKKARIERHFGWVVQEN